MIVIDDIRQDLRYGLRSLWSSPGFTAAALLTLALGIGANTAIFSVVRSVLLEPLPFREADRIVRVYHANPSNRIAQGTASEPDFLDWRRASRTAGRRAGPERRPGKPRRTSPRRKTTPTAHSSGLRAGRRRHSQEP